MEKSRAKYMRDYRLKKRKEKLIGKVITSSTIQRYTDYEARTAKLKSLQVSTADPNTAPPNLDASQPLSPTPSTSTAIECDTDTEESNSRPADVVPERVVPEYVEPVEHVVNGVTVRQYENYQKCSAAHDSFKTKFLDMNFGSVCNVCDRLWYENNMKSIPPNSKKIIKAAFPDLNFETAIVCCTCHSALSRKKMPTLSKSNGFRYPPKPSHLPELDFVSERLISPRLPFTTIRRLRKGNGQDGAVENVINESVPNENMVRNLARDLNDEYATNIHIQWKKIHKSAYLKEYTKTQGINKWLEYLTKQELYKLYEITMEASLLNADSVDEIDHDEFSEVIEVAESLTAQQKPLLCNENKYLCLAPGETVLPKAVSFEKHSEELSFPSIYLGQFRSFKGHVRVTPFMMLTSELRRSDRRGVIPAHLLFMAMNVSRCRKRNTLKVAVKFTNKDSPVSRPQLESPDYINDCIDTDLAFLSHIPNSAFYWAKRKKDLFATIRQLGKPTFFLTMSANEIGWPKLMKLLYKLKNDGAEIDDDTVRSLPYNTKVTLVNEDPVICAIHFNKLIETIMEILQSKVNSPFGRHYVTNFFKRIDFQYRGIPRAHILLWLNKAPDDAINGDQIDAIELIDSLMNVSKENASGYEKLQEHKHTFTCYKKIGYAVSQKCRFGAPFLPSRSTVILIPMPSDDPRRIVLAKIYHRLWKSLEVNDYKDMDHFFKEHDILSDEFYLDVLRAGIYRPMVFLKRKTSEKWMISYNPFILNVLGATMDFQFIIEEYSCATYVAEYINKTNRGITKLQRKIIGVIDEHPEYDIAEVTRNQGIELLNEGEMTSQEAAWFLLRMSMSLSSVNVIYIATVRSVERQRIRKTLEKLNIDKDDDDGSNNSLRNNCFEQYEKRPKELEDLSLAQATAYYIVSNNDWGKRRLGPRIIRYRNYDIATELEEYKREMVTLYLPFRSEKNEILANRKYIKLYDDNEIIIMQARKEFESNVDIAKTMEICRQVCIEHEGFDLDDDESLSDRVPGDASTEINADIPMALLSRLGPLDKNRETFLLEEDCNKLMQMADNEQRSLIMDALNTLFDSELDPVDPVESVDV